MLTYRWVLIFSIGCAIISAAMLLYNRMTGDATAGSYAIPFMFLFTGLLGMYVGEAMRELSLRVETLEKRFGECQQRSAGKMEQRN